MPSPVWPLLIYLTPTRWTWVWVNSGSWWWTGRPGMLQSMGSQRVRHDWVTELNSTEFTLTHKSNNIPGSYEILFLQHQTLLPLPVTYTTGHCFRFGSISSFFLELFLHSSTVAFWAPTNLGSSSLSYLFAFSYCSWGSQARILKWFAISFSRGPHFVRTLHHDPSTLGGGSSGSHTPTSVFLQLLWYLFPLTHQHCIQGWHASVLPPEIRCPQDQPIWWIAPHSSHKGSQKENDT